MGFSSGLLLFRPGLGPAASSSNLPLAYQRHGVLLRWSVTHTIRFRAATAGDPSETTGTHSGRVTTHSASASLLGGTAHLRRRCQGLRQSFLSTCLGLTQSRMDNKRRSVPAGDGPLICL
ncbi:hypothetical protein BGZ61DRAFT_438868 [Ilyonectria robusta]|uniref:uncharacterized protein n=1 Tax=Ilyonectria robusta TaxID=1079257 RepID=UPI001E8E5AC7|nr:uncharacterized protein BGZ61DRAFT_438868 [Ilyonectria robusta]KAH8737715.1 hypothetical protein BGZ61DRAFT_438868 [Ilyonectria robusta]